jgi:hypothetical protein
MPGVNSGEAISRISMLARGSSGNHRWMQYSGGVMVVTVRTFLATGL